MKFRLEQRLASPPADACRAFTQPAFYATLQGLPKLTVPELISHEADGDLVHLRLRYRFIGELNSAARAVLDPQRLSWVEESVHDVGRQRAEFRLKPDNYGDRFTCSGRSTFTPGGAGTVHVTEGELKVRWPLVGGTVERALVSGLQEHFEAEAPFIDAFVANNTG